MSDYVIRATAANGQIRAFAVTNRDMAETARQHHNTSPVISAALGRLMAAAAMMGSMMKGDRDTLTLKIQGDGPVENITVVADSRGNVKGYAKNPQVMLPPNEKGKLDVGGAVGKGMLTVIRDIGMREPYMGSCQLVTGEIAEDLTYYFAASEQTPSSVGLGVLMNHENTVRCAGGFIVQLMPGVEDSVIDQLEKKIGEITSVTNMLNQGMNPEEILQYILGDFGLDILEKTETRFFCDCSKQKVQRAIVSLGQADLESLIADHEPVEAVCDFCSTSYWFQPEELETILEASKKKN